MITEQDLHDYNKWLMEVWNPNQLYIPFGVDAPKAYLKYKSEKEAQANGVQASDEQALPIQNVVQQSEQLKAIVFKIANMLAVAGKGDQAVQMHRIHNSL